ncbi:glyoxal reductase-like isoform X1 [Polypterus senegalus]|uniref:glyoxal reductase-like isoform X1 n=1 Tax=Polypterus senegalus TaxID=55291 RepID=UPI001966125F|nr:glyoxal reductase-like isoform X1 [Polypterus senegalus]
MVGSVGHVTKNGNGGNALLSRTESLLIVALGCVDAMAQTIELNNGVQMPIFGLGTFRIRDYDVVFQTLDIALKMGYRSFDTATVYRNEHAIGCALKTLLPKYGLLRKDIFITSKLAPKDHGLEAESACNHSLQQLDFDFVDLYLIHWPGKQGLKAEDAKNKDYRKQSWKAMEKLYKNGKFRALGVSNYTISHLQELLDKCEIKPAVLQVEYHPKLVQTDLLKFCQHNNIHLQAYSSLGVGNLVLEPKIIELAKKYKKTPAQILLCWATQQGIGVIPKSVNPDRIAENINIFDFHLSTQDITEINSLNSGTRYCWDPQGIA